MRIVTYIWSRLHANSVIIFSENIIKRHHYMTNLCQHDEPHEEGDHSHCQDEELPAVFTAKGGGIHIHHGCHQALHTHKLIKRETRHMRYLYTCLHVCLFKLEGSVDC